MTSSTSESLPPVASADDFMAQRPKILEALGYRVTALTRIVVKKAREVPVVGTSIGCVEDTVSPWLEPIIGHVEKDGLYLLSLVDDKIHTVSDVAMAHVPFAENFIPPLQGILSGEPIDAVLMVLDRVRRRGVVGSTADMWVDYEPVVKSESQKIYNLVIGVPGVRFVVSIVSDISSPLVSMASDWLVMHSEVKDKHEIFLQREVSTSSLNSPVTPSKVTDADEPTAVDFNALADDSDPDLEQTTHPSYAEIVKSTEGAQNSKGEIDSVPLQEGESASSDTKGKLPELTVVHQHEEEQDELSDLFDTWGMGVKAINPKGLTNLRSKTLQVGAGSEKPPPKPFNSLSTSFQL